MRITAIEIENFKGISDRVRVDLKPITLLFGANSAGKSTILHALLYMKDVLERRNLDAITTPVSGRALDLGGFRNFVHGQDLNRTVRIRVCMDGNGMDLPVMAPDYDLPMPMSGKPLEVQMSLQDTRLQMLKSITSATVEIEVRWDQVSGKPVTFAYAVGLNGTNFVRIEYVNDKRTVGEFNLTNPAVSRPCTEEERWILGELTDDDVIPAEIGAPFPLLGQILPLFEGGKSRLTGLINWLPPHDPIPDFAFRDALRLPSTSWQFKDCWNDDESDEECMEIANSWAWDGTTFLARLIVGPGKLVRDWLQGLRYIGPLRSRPPRDGIAPEELDDWSEGLAAWKALDNTTPEIFREISDWLSRKDRLNTGYSLRSTPLVELEANDLKREVLGGITPERLAELLEKAPKRTRINLVTEAPPHLRLSPSDVGVGIAQVLPVVGGAIVPNPQQEPAVTLVAIEQPELHIHPAMQVALGDLFIEGVAKRGMSFLIETHSEHLLLRLLRRIREKAESESPSELPGLSSDDISVLYVERSGAEQVEILSIEIDQSGKFVSRWPRGFFPERMHEALPKEIRERVDSKTRGVE